MVSFPKYILHSDSNRHWYSCQLPTYTDNGKNLIELDKKKGFFLLLFLLLWKKKEANWLPLFYGNAILSLNINLRKWSFWHVFYSVLLWIKELEKLFIHDSYLHRINFVIRSEIRWIFCKYPQKKFELKLNMNAHTHTPTAINRKKLKFQQIKSRVIDPCHWDKD